MTTAKTARMFRWVFAAHMAGNGLVYVVAGGANFLVGALVLALASVYFARIEALSLPAHPECMS
jgi:hypothetical protein